MKFHAFLALANNINNTLMPVKSYSDNIYYFLVHSETYYDFNLDY